METLFRWSRKRVHCCNADLFRILLTEFYQCRVSFAEDVTIIFWRTLFSESQCSGNISLYILAHLKITDWWNNRYYCYMYCYYYYCYYYYFYCYMYCYCYYYYYYYFYCYMYCYYYYFYCYMYCYYYYYYYYFYCYMYCYVCYEVSSSLSSVNRKNSRLSSSSDDDLDERRRLFLQRNRCFILSYILID